jgi:hypothetical protein
MRTANRQQFKRELQEEIRHAEQELDEQMSEEYLAFEEYMQNMEGYDYELDWLDDYDYIGVICDDLKDDDEWY